VEEGDGLGPPSIADGRGDGSQGRRRQRDVYAALDLGTNNCRLLVAAPTWAGFRVVDAFSRLVRLGEGLGASDRLSEPAIRRTIDALRVCANKIHARNVTRARLIATQACRVAVNGRDFLDRVATETGLELEIIDERTEAMLAAAGCASLADPQAESVLLFDIGGGSSEIVWLGRKGEGARRDITARARAWASLPVGVVTLAERHGGREVSRESFETMVSLVADALADFRARASTASECPNFHLLGTSGTVTTLAGIHLGLTRYDRRRVDGLWMNTDDVIAVVDRLLLLDHRGRAESPCIGPERADLVLAGCAILEAIRRAFPSQRMRVADRGLREGILTEMMTGDGVWRRRRRQDA
jgi:exopolyphosphatase/guanosine-5'-triphosphate,3'-diphosphate pyrophosphatase